MTRTRLVALAIVSAVAVTLAGCGTSGSPYAATPKQFLNAVHALYAAQRRYDSAASNINTANAKYARAASALGNAWETFDSKLAGLRVPQEDSTDVHELINDGSAIVDALDSVTPDGSNTCLASGSNVFSPCGPWAENVARWHQQLTTVTADVGALLK